MRRPKPLFWLRILATWVTQSPNMCRTHRNKFIINSTHELQSCKTKCEKSQYGSYKVVTWVTRILNLGHASSQQESIEPQLELHEFTLWIKKKKKHGSQNESLKVETRFEQSRNTFGQSSKMRCAKSQHRSHKSQHGSRKSQHGLNKVANCFSQISIMDLAKSHYASRSFETWVTRSRLFGRAKS